MHMSVLYFVKKTSSPTMNYECVLFLCIMGRIIFFHTYPLLSQVLVVKANGKSYKIPTVDHKHQHLAYLFPKYIIFCEGKIKSREE